MDNKRLLELAGVQLNENNMGKYVSDMADIFEQAIDEAPVEMGDDEYGDFVNTLEDDLHQELRNRGVFG